MEEGAHVLEVGYWEGAELEKVVAAVQQAVEGPKKEVEVRMMMAVVGLIKLMAFESQEVEEVSCQ